MKVQRLHAGLGELTDLMRWLEGRLYGANGINRDDKPEFWQGHLEVYDEVSRRAKKLKAQILTFKKD